MPSPIPLDFFPGAGTFTLTGKDVGLSATNRMQAGVGTFGVVGYLTDFAATNRMRAQAGDFVVDTAAISLVATPTLAAGAGDFAHSGKAISTTPSPLPTWFGPSATDCDCCPCSECIPMFAEYGVTQLSLTGVRGPVALVTDPGSTPYTWEGFLPGTTALPEATCISYVYDNFDAYTTPIPFGLYKKTISDSVGLWGGGTNGSRPQLTCSNWFQCGAVTPNVPWYSFGIRVTYSLKGVALATLISEGSFSDWAWDDVIVGGFFPIYYRRARKTYTDGTVATFQYGPLGPYPGSIQNVSASIGYTGDILTPTLPVRSVTMPSMPYDYLGAFVGTATI